MARIYLINNKVVTSSSSHGFGSAWVEFGLGLVRNLENFWFWFGSGFWDNLPVWFCFILTKPKNHLSKILLFLKIFINFLKKYKNSV